MRLIKKARSLKIGLFSTDKRALMRKHKRKLLSPFGAYIIKPLSYDADLKGFLVGYEFPAHNIRELFLIAYAKDEHAQNKQIADRRRYYQKVIRPHKIKQRNLLKRIRIKTVFRVCKLPMWDFKTLVERARDEARQVLIDDLV